MSWRSLEIADPASGAEPSGLMKDSLPNGNHAGVVTAPDSDASMLCGKTKVAMPMSDAKPMLKHYANGEGSNRDMTSSVDRKPEDRTRTHPVCVCVRALVHAYWCICGPAP